ncbi:hypothetical protein [[Limnothrix rosea] IAM M-220]|uniref:hypothetical protein n=1 Tax=[Limnothrix rosea] IAM M-220 TaxID=454133 RepID=UPI000963DABD|nr:hypothetical protein [[Limnothrix rosea] IAM M-220]OKH19072.1 hypothetical protein NIES208_03640 [[Limnothrix rosea] IAM M-220]
MFQDKSSITQFKIFGERHTATNIIAKLIIQNFNLDYRYYDFLGWKHRKAPSVKELQSEPLVLNTLFLITVRHPYEWAAAMHRRPYCDYDALIHRYGFKDFLKYPIEDYANVLDMWNQKYASYQKFMELVPYGMIIRYEDFKQDQLSVLKRLYQWLPEPTVPKAITEYMHGGDTWTLKFVERRIGNTIYRHWAEYPPEPSKAPASHKKPLAEITRDIIEMIDSQIDKSVLDYFYPKN